MFREHKVCKTHEMRAEKDNMNGWYEKYWDRQWCAVRKLIICHTGTNTMKTHLAHGCEYGMRLGYQTTIAQISQSIAHWVELECGWNNSSRLHEKEIYITTSHHITTHRIVVPFASKPYTTQIPGWHVFLTGKFTVSRVWKNIYRPHENIRIRAHKSHAVYIAHVFRTYNTHSQATTTVAHKSYNYFYNQMKTFLPIRLLKFHGYRFMILHNFE